MSTLTLRRLGVIACTAALVAGLGTTASASATPTTAPITSALATTLTTATPTTAPASAGERVVISESFDANTMPAGFTPIEGGWTVRDGRLYGDTTSGVIGRLTFGEHLEAYRFEATVRFEKVNNPGRWSAMGLDLARNGSVPWWIATHRTGTTAPNGLEFAQRTPTNGWNVTDTASAPYDASVGRDVRVSIEVQGNRATWSFDGQERLRTRALQRSEAGVLGFVANGALVSYDDVKVTELPFVTQPVLRKPGEDMAVVAHRGYSQVAPENTLAAFESAGRVGADYIESDVQTAADGTRVLLHDGTLNRTTTGTGLLALASWSYLSTLDAGSWFSFAFAKQPLPTFDQYLAINKARGASPLIEVKGPETRAEVERIVADIEDAGMIDSTTLQSFDTAVLEYAYEANPRLRLGLLRGTLDADPVAAAKKYHAVSYNPSWGALKGKPGVVADLHAAGVAVMPYTINAPAEWAIIDSYGVDGIITDRPGQLIGWQAARAAIPKPTLEFAAPQADAVVTRGEVIVPVLTSSYAESVEVTLDGKPVAEGQVIEVDSLALGEHALVACATGFGGVTVTASTTFTVKATAAGLRHLVLEADINRGTRTALLVAIDAKAWNTVIALASRKVDSPLREVIIGDAKALRH